MNKITSILIILVCAILLGGGVFWYVETRPITIVPPGDQPLLPVPKKIIPAPTPAPQGTPDTRSWGERMRDPAIPDVQGVVWQIYTNKEYGFEMEYPNGFWIEMSKSNNKYRGSYIIDVHPPGPPNPHVYGEEHPYRTLISIDISPKSLREFVGEGSSLGQRFKKQETTPDATIHEINLFIENPDGQSDQNFLFLYFEKYGHSYGISETHPSDNEKERQLTEHMVKTFRFLK